MPENASPSPEKNGALPVRNPRLPALRKRIGSVSQKPGVYRWLDADGNVLYVGKAKNVRNRLRSYVQPGQKHSAWKDMLVRQIADMDITIVNSDLEALILETNLIKELSPKYNIMMKDDKNYVYVRISMRDSYPRVDVTRRMEEDGALYFGPKTSAEQVRTSLAFLRKIFPFRTCKMEIEPVEESRRKDGDTRIRIDVRCKNRDRPTPCLDHHIKQCTAPCVGYVTPEEYRRESIDGVVSFFRGRHEEVERLLRERMEEAAAARKFERAAALRDQLKTLERMQEKQLVSDTTRENMDVIGIALNTGNTYAVLLQQRDGKLIGEEHFVLRGAADAASEVLPRFLTQFYENAGDVPDVIFAAEEPEDRAVLEEWLRGKRGKKVEIRVPQRGKKYALLDLAQRNAAWKAQQSEARWESEARKVGDALAKLGDALSLPFPPARIEGYDISHLGGTETVGSMVVFDKGYPKRDHYRSFTIRTLREGDIDDYRALGEVLRRRLLHLVRNVKEEEQAWKKEHGITFGRMRKAEADDIMALLNTGGTKNQHNAVDALADGETVLVAREGEKTAGVARLSPLGTMRELSSLWVDPARKDPALPAFLVRRILKTVKKGKVYLLCPPGETEFFMEAGFRPVRKAPQALEKKMRGDVLPMAYVVAEHKEDASLGARPDLLLIDGGKGQLNAVCSVLDALHLTIPVIGLAKREEEVFLPGSSLPVEFPKDSSALFLLQRIRDEAHRFANNHRETRGWKSTTRSALDGIPGIGPKTKAALLKEFKTVARLRETPDDALARFLSPGQIEALREAFSRKADA